MSALGPGPAFAPVVPARQALVQRAACDGLRMGLSVPFSQATNDLMRSLGLAWSPLRRMWVCDVQDMRRVLDGIGTATQDPRYSDLDGEGARAVAVTAWQNPQPAYFAELLDVQILPLRSGGVALASGFDP